jgi:hypothetical protein
LLDFFDVHEVALSGMLSGFLIGGVFTIWPRLIARLYAALLPISPTVIRRIGWVGLGWGVWSTVALIVHVWFGFDLMGHAPFDD